MQSFKTVEANRPCPISGTNEALEVYAVDRHGKDLRNVINKASGLIYVDPVPFKNTEAFYRTEYRKSYKGVLTPKPKHIYRAGKNALKRLKLLEPILKPEARILDAGSSSGEFVYLSAKKGYISSGLEANVPYAEFSKQALGIEVTNNAFSEFSTETTYDCITLFHVLEHLEHPKRDLLHLSKNLQVGGIIAIEVPNIAYHKMALKHKWHPGHLYSYTPATLAALLQSLGFEIVQCEKVDKDANVFGVFKKNQNPKPVSLPQEIQARAHVERLRKDNFIYYCNLLTYIKPIPKLIKNFQEKCAANRKSPIEILDSLVI